MSQWVQHISGQGKRWENVDTFRCTSEWMVKGEMAGSHYFLPKSEFIICDPPEVWEDVTYKCTFAKDSGLTFDGYRMDYDKYRLRKVGVEWFSGVPLGETRKGSAFIVEKKKS